MRHDGVESKAYALASRMLAFVLVMGREKKKLNGSKCRGYKKVLKKKFKKLNPKQ